MTCGHRACMQWGAADWLGARFRHDRDNDNDAVTGAVAPASVAAPLHVQPAVVLTVRCTGNADDGGLRGPGATPPPSPRRLARPHGGDGTTQPWAPACGPISPQIEHRLSSFISINWRGRTLTDIRTIVELIAATKTKTGLTVEAAYDPNWYPTGEKITDGDYATIPLAPHDWHGEWNYDIASPTA